MLIAVTDFASLSFYEVAILSLRKLCLCSPVNCLMRLRFLLARQSCYDKDLLGSPYCVLIPSDYIVEERDLRDSGYFLLSYFCWISSIPSRRGSLLLLWVLETTIMVRMLRELTLIFSGAKCVSCRVNWVFYPSLGWEDVRVGLYILKLYQDLILKEQFTCEAVVFVGVLIAFGGGNPCCW